MLEDTCNSSSSMKWKIVEFAGHVEKCGIGEAGRVDLGPCGGLRDAVV